MESSLIDSHNRSRDDNEYMAIVSQELRASKNSRLAISNEIDRLSHLINNQVQENKQTEKQLKKVIYEISYQQLNQMDRLLRDFLATKKL